MNKAKLIKLCNESDAFIYGGELYLIALVSNHILYTINDGKEIDFDLDEILSNIDAFEFYELRKKEVK